ncbi:hypothetical protein [Arabidopsis thaliana]|uniref:Uncharacterized protein AT4g17080 n=1 Tax=Arabidopsis thaliana TaxID=3702 RepID=O23552_ARATH|nr:hypothetical protein [Arabidopsis thaliana]CAB80979.1 hypothetical protein [Arabidopsis thaliana]
MHLKNSTVAERRYIGKETAGYLTSSSDLDPKPKIKHHRPLQVPEILTPDIGAGAGFSVYNNQVQAQSRHHLTVEIPDSSSHNLTSKRPVVVQSSNPFNVDDFRRQQRASLGPISSYCPSYLLSWFSSSLPSIHRPLIRSFSVMFLEFFLLFVFSIIAFSFVLSISLKFALPHLPSIRLIIARLLSLKLTPTRSSSSSQENTKHVIWSIGSKPVTEKKTSSGSWVQKYSSGDVYEGEFHRGKCSGSGVYYYSMKGKYEGDWIDGKYDGYGVETWAKGSRYRGQYRQGMRHGTGIYRFYTGDVYAGEWSNGQSHGCGVYTSEDGSRFVGEFKWGVKHGLGHYHFRMHGFGVYQFGNGHRYEGAWHEGRRQGLGMYTFRNGETQAGHWEDGVLNCPTEQTTRPDSSFSISHSKVVDTVQQARKAAKKAREVVKVEERVNRAVMVANRAANAARVAATKAVQTQTFHCSSGDDPL